MEKIACEMLRFANGVIDVLAVMVTVGVLVTVVAGIGIWAIL